jgi:dTDP-glucose 4,6-dehydratase
MAQNQHQHIMITGGAGFIGSALVAHAVEQGAQVLVVDALTYAGHIENLNWIKAQNYPGNFTFIEANILQTDRMLSLMREHKLSAVIHAAAESHVDNSIAAAGAFIETNVQGTQSMLDAARAHWRDADDDIKAHFRFLQISTDEVYGALGEQGVFDLQSPIAPNSPYAASKAAADLLVRACHKTHGLPTLITRCCNNYGPRQHPEKLIPRMIDKALKGEALPVYGSGKQVREWVHVDDHAKGVFATLSGAEIGSVTHLGSGVEHTNLEIIHAICSLIAQETGRDASNQITHVADRLGHDFRYALDLSSSVETLGFSAHIGFDEGLQNTLRWYLDNAKWVEIILAHTQAKRRAA